MRTDRVYFVYRVLNADGELLYVGCTKRLGTRWSEHKSAWPGMVAAAVRCRIQGPYTYEKARELERIAIRTEEPIVGWTPAKHREKCARNRWIENRVEQLLRHGIDSNPGVSQALAEAREWFPDPYELENIYRKRAAA